MSYELRAAMSWARQLQELQSFAAYDVSSYEFSYVSIVIAPSAKI
jgi:hypothetical protein